MAQTSKPANNTLRSEIDGIRVLPGDAGVVLVAPHGSFESGPDGKPHYRNDERTGLIAEAVYEESSWFTVINDAFIKPNTEPQVEPNLKTKRLDLFKIEQADKVPGYLDAIKNAIDAHTGKTLVIWLHGMSDKSAKTQEGNLTKAGAMEKGAGELQALIGYGQGAHPQFAKLKKKTAADHASRPSAGETTVAKFCDALTGQGLFTLPAEDSSSNFRGRDPKRLNQWFLNQGYPFDAVESIQIEIREKGFRENSGQCRKTASILVRALTRTIHETQKLEL